MTLAALQPTACLDLHGSEDGDAYLKLRARTICELNLRCCSGESVRSTLVECLPDRPRELEDALAAGEIRVNLPRAERCFESVSQLSCDEWAEVLRGGPVPAECSNLFDGRANGERCTSYGHCESQYCDKTNPATRPYEGREGVCGEKAGLNEPCLVDSRSCQPGLSCRGVGGDVTCVPKIVDGEVCGLQYHYSCASDLCIEGVCGPTCWGQPSQPALLGAP